MVRAFQSLKRLKLLSVSNTMAWRRLVSTFSVIVRLDGRNRATSTNRAPTIAVEIRISSKRVIQGSPGPIPAVAGASGQSYQEPPAHGESKMRPARGRATVAHATDAALAGREVRRRPRDLHGGARDRVAPPAQQASARSMARPPPAPSRGPPPRQDRPACPRPAAARRP